MLSICIGVWSGVEARASLTVYDQADLSGPSAVITNTYTIYSDTGIPSELNNAISSFRLEQGYMAVLADQPDGYQPSKVYIASDGPLIVNSLPTELDNAISFIRLVPWKDTLKKGLGEQDDGVVEAVQPSWFYDWGASALHGTAVTNWEFVPMSWGHMGTYPDDIANYLSQDQVTHLLSFNEPDKSTEQSGQWGSLYIVSTAVTYHASLQQAGLRLGSPAAHEEGAGGAASWLTQFLDQTAAATIRVDYVALHWYDWGSSPAVNTNPTPEEVLTRFKSYLSNAYNLYRKPLWITEFNANVNRSREIQDAFLQIAMPYLDSCGYVERYAYFQPGNGIADFLDGSSNITSTGIVYRDHVSSPAYVPKDLPPQWQALDVGTVGAVGDAIHANGTFTVCGSGAGVTGSSDEFHFVCQTVTNDVALTAKINSMVWRNNSAIGGVMIREDLTAGSKHVFMSLTASSGAQFRCRASAGATSTTTTASGIKAPHWVKLERVGDDFTGYRSPDGTNWTQVGAATIAMSNVAYVGLAVSANNDTKFNDTIFTEVEMILDGDYDGDGMRDSWETSHFGSVTNTEGGLLEDQDEDGFIDLHEYLAGTNPTNGNSRLIVTEEQIGVSLDQIVLTWQAVLGKTYSILSTSALTNTVWTTNQPGIPGIEPACVYTVNTSGAKSFYKIKLED